METDNSKMARNNQEQNNQEQNKDSLAWEVVRSEELVSDQWMKFRKLRYRFPDGTEFEPYYNYSRRDYVVVVAKDETGNYLCVRQFRPGLGKVTTEFTAGGIEQPGKNGFGMGLDLPEEIALEAAKRELLEETGYTSEEWKHLLTVPSNATLADNYAHLYFAGNCRKVADQDLDDTEYLNVYRLSEQELSDRIKNGEFEQAIHILAWKLAKV